MKTLLILSMVLVVISMLVLTFRYIYYLELGYYNYRVWYNRLLVGGIVGLVLGLLGIVFSYGLDIYGIIMVIVNLGVFGLLLYYCHWNDNHSWPVHICVLLVWGFCLCEMFLKYRTLNCDSSLWSQQLLVGTMFLSCQCFFVPFLFEFCGRKIERPIVLSIMSGMGLIILRVLMMTTGL